MLIACSLIPITCRGDGEIMRAANSCPRHHRCLRRPSCSASSFARAGVSRVPIRRNTNKIHPAPTDPGGRIMFPGIPGYPLSSGVPTLINGPAKGLWPGAGLTHPLSEAYHRCCCTPPGLLTNNMNFCELFFVSRLLSLQLQLNISFSFDLPLFFPFCILNSDILKAQTPAPSKLTLRPPAARSLGSLLPIFLPVGLTLVVGST